MKLIIGLGNPGTKYLQTRHNAGFLAVDYFLKDKQPITCQSKFKAQICELHFENNQKVLFIKPETFMNNSGQAVNDIMQFYKVSPSVIMVIHDDKDLLLGKIKLTDDSSAAGHNGVQSLIDHLGTQQFARIRIGVESREPGSPIPTDVFVLQNFSDEESKQLEEKILPQIHSEIQKFITSTPVS